MHAARALQSSAPEVQFVLCGSGSHEVAIKDAFADCANVIFPGEVDAAALKVLRAKAIAALQPVERRVDYQNSYSNKFFEYLSAGLPVFSWLDGISGQKLVSEQCGFIYNNADELVRQMSDFFDNDALRSDMSQRARALFDREFDAAVVYEAYAEHLEAVLADSKVNQRA